MPLDGPAAIGSPTADKLIARARALAPLVRECRAAIERERRLPDALVQAFVAAGFMRVKLPACLGGVGGGHPVTAIRIVEEVSRADGAAGWNLCLGLGQAIYAGFMREETARAIWAENPDTIIAGGINPPGRAIVQPGGYRVSGRFGFASGCHQATRLFGNCRIYDDEQSHSRRNPDGSPAMRFMLFRPEECEILDTWHTGGLRGTGSNDVAVRDRFVPEELSFSLNDPAWPADPLYRFPFYTQGSLAGVALGLARGAIDALIELAQAKTPTGQTSLLRERAAVQADVARAEALWRSSRAYLFEALDEAWQTALRGDPPSREQRVQIRLANIYAGEASARAVDLMYNAAGATAIYEASPLERHFRDVHVAVQHFLLQGVQIEDPGRALLGLPTRGPL